MQHEQTVISADESINVRQIIRKLLPHWPWFVLSVIVALLVGFIFIKSAPTSYESSAILLIKSNDQGANINSLIWNQAPKANISNEAGIIQSINTKLEALKYIDGQISYYISSRFKTTECYRNTPFHISIDTSHQQLLNTPINIALTEDNSVSIKIDAQESPIGLVDQIESRGITDLKIDTVIEPNTWFSTAEMRFKIDSLKNEKSYNTYFIINSISRQISFFEHLNLDVDKESSLLQISLRATTPQKAVDFLNSLIKAYLNLETNKRIDEKAENIGFINELLLEVSDTLKLYEQELTRFQTKHLTLGIAPKSNDLYAKYSELRNQLGRLSLQQRYYHHVLTLLQDEKSLGDLISPQVLGINEPVVSDLVKQLIDLYNQKSEISFNTRKENPYVNVVDEKITNLKSSLITNVKNNIEALQLSQKEHEKQLKTIEGELGKLPLTNKQLTNYERKFKIIDELYTFLLKRRSEARIEKAATRAQNEVIQDAGSLTTQTKSINPIQILLLSVLLGLMLPFGVIQFKSYLSNVLETEEQLQKITAISTIGQIFKVKGENKHIFDDVQSQEAECFRTIRANTAFFIEKIESQTILITSSQKGDGKSFVAYNLAAAFSKNKQKTLYIDFDLRKPSAGLCGLSTYLSEQVKLDEIVKEQSEFFHTIASGPVPPNPSELINRKSTKHLFEKLKKRYEIIIIDTPPLMPVSDASLLAEFSDMQLFVVRYNHTMLDAIKATINGTQFKSLSNVTILANDVKKSQKYYYYKY